NACRRDANERPRPYIRVGALHSSDWRQRLSVDVAVVPTEIAANIRIRVGTDVAAGAVGHIRTRGGAHLGRRQRTGDRAEDDGESDSCLGKHSRISCLTHAVLGERCRNIKTRTIGLSVKRFTRSSLPLCLMQPQGAIQRGGPTCASSSLRSEFLSLPRWP